MPLADLQIPGVAPTLPADVRAFLREAARRIDRLHARSLLPGFVPCDFVRAYAALQGLTEGGAAPGNLFCEWGSGFGVVACLAAMLGFDAAGIEIESELVDAAQQLADDFELPVQFVCGSFIPPGGAALARSVGPFEWFTPEAGTTEEELGLGPGDFDVIFAYPWPDEEQLVEKLFERYAAAGAVLVTYHGVEELRLRRKRPGRIAKR